MESSTFKTRIAKLIQKSRKAVRLYSSVSKVGTGISGEVADLQMATWKNVNTDLLQQLTAAFDTNNSRKLVSDIFSVKDYFHSNWRDSEVQLRKFQEELISASELGDFAKAALISKRLVSLKAKVEASEAAYHEIEAVIRQSKVAPVTIKLEEEDILAEEELPKLAKVIPFGA